MKSKKCLPILAVLLCAAACLFSACGTPAQNVATGIYLAGNDFATRELGKNPGSLKGLQDLAKALPDIPSGKVTPFEMGVLNAELQAINKAESDPAQAKNVDALNRIGSLISAAVQANAGATGGNPTAVTAVAAADCADFANGINHAILFWQGQQSVTTPPAP